MKVKFGLKKPTVANNFPHWMSAASIAVMATSGERHEGKARMVLFAGKTVWSMPERFVRTLVRKGAI